ncbi:hypothetical protein HON52_03795 [Candidatus Uhrbacteria bacterium]|nr:hypothetical protein [Candidatus Uhrbacteria bacterium]
MNDVELIHRVYIPTSSILCNFYVRCVKKSINFDRFTWDGSENPPEFDMDDPETVVVLEASLGSLRETHEFASEWAGDGQETYHPDEDIITDQSGLRLLKGSEEFQPWTLRWRRIKLDVNIYKGVDEVRDPKRSPGIALIYVAAQHPQRMKEILTHSRMGWSIPGLEYRTPHDTWRQILVVNLYSFGGKQAELHLYLSYDLIKCYHTTIPVYRE